ncbi:hypothetical protein LC087_01860 [Bacillus carboniphilus]|uniref:Uncharacterized protein n=1 Tax=Bacillus carboniphilus TaxID=86663 RepID=A0ABY9JX39_9BACI|nr:hypothetical protein [Bacillus carboniphilus]WLR42990.1 hypothetical protein LC087_01860 [Bacillus carboniphilus]
MKSSYTRKDGREVVVINGSSSSFKKRKQTKKELKKVKVTDSMDEWMRKRTCQDCYGWLYGKNN